MTTIRDTIKKGERGKPENRKGYQLVDQRVSFKENNLMDRARESDWVKTK